MIFNDDILFIHAPKTGGMAMTHTLLNSLSDTPYYCAPKGHHNVNYGQHGLIGKRHATLAHARDFLAALESPRQLSDFNMIFAIIRNPYEIEISRFNYLQKGNKWDKGQAQELAMKKDFDAFAEQSKWFHPFEAYYHLNGNIPDNMYIFRHEDLAQVLPFHLQPYLKSKFSMPRKNATKKAKLSKVINKTNEPFIYEKYQWLFDKGFYSRMIF